MARIAKKPEKRRQEIIDTALELFLEQGFEKTTVQEIVKKMKVAQDTFYYHFASKQLVLDSVIEHITDLMMKNIVQTMQDKRHDPFSRVETIVSEAISREITPRFGLLHELHEEHMLMIHFRITASVEKTLMPGFIELLEEGVKLGVFKSKNIEEVAETLFATIQYFSHLNEFRNSEAKQRKVCRFLEQMIEKLLATHPRKFTITLDKTMGANSLEKILVRQPSVKEVHP